MAITTVNVTLSEFQYYEYSFGSVGSYSFNSPIPTFQLLNENSTWVMKGYATGNLGTHTIQVRDTLFPSDGWDIVVELVDGQGLVRCECLDHPILLEWVNLAGGRSTHTFDLKSIRSITSGDSQTWTNAQGVERRYNIRGKRYRIEATTDMGIREILQVVRSLNTSIQAWAHFGNGVMTPILADNEQVVYLNENDLQGYTIGFEVAQDIRIQAQ